MKITKQRLKQIIKEELTKALNEQNESLCDVIQARPIGNDKLFIFKIISRPAVQRGQPIEVKYRKKQTIEDFQAYINKMYAPARQRSGRAPKLCIFDPIKSEYKEIKPSEVTNKCSDGC